MVRSGRTVAAAIVAAVACAGPAQGDEVKDEVEALKRKVLEQERRIRELEQGGTPSPDEVAIAVDRYLASTPHAAVVVAGEGGGKAGWPLGGAPFIAEGPNKIQLHLRNQVRWSTFLYSDDAVGTLATPPATLSDAAPRDRSGFELERLYFGVDGTVFCPDVSFHLTLNFDSDGGSGVEKEFAWIDWKYAGEHHVRAGTDKVPFTIEEQTSSAALAFVDRSLFTKAFALDSDTGVQLWGHFGPCDCPKQFLYKVMVSTGEGPIHSAGSVFNTDAFDTYSDQLLYSAMLEWTITGKDWKLDEVDSRPGAERCRLDASLGVAGYYENDDDVSQKAVGMALRASGPLERRGVGAWLRARWQGFSLLAEAAMRDVDYTRGSLAPDQTDYGATVTVHYRFCDSNFGVGAKAGWIWLDDDYDTLTVGGMPVGIEDTISEYGVVVNYFFWDHGNKLSADVTWVSENSAVRSSSAGYFFDPSKGIVVEDGVYVRVQWQLNF